MLPVRVSVQGQALDRTAWLRLAAEVEAADLECLYVADHPGSGPAPFVALAAAAAVTERIRLGTCVVNAGWWEPLALAAEVATLDLLSGGRALLGLGAGHTPSEWTSVGRPYPSAGRRVDRLIELATLTRSLLAGASITHHGEHFDLVDATLRNPRPVQVPVPLMVGGNGVRVLRFGAEIADVVGITGLGRTLPDGHRHAIDWSPSALTRTLDAVTSTAADAGRQPDIEALVQHVELTDDAAAAAAALAANVPGASEADLLATPFVWIGTVDEIRHRLRAHHAAGISRYVVRDRALPQVLEVLSRP